MSQVTGGWLNGIVPRGQSYLFKSAVTQAGTLLKKTTTAMEVDIAGASDRPVGYAYDNTTGTAFHTSDLTKKYTVMPLINGEKVAFPLLATNAAISIGDTVVLVAGGKIDKKSGAGYVIGVAEDSAAQNDGATGTPFLAVRTDFRYESA